MVFLIINLSTYTISKYACIAVCDCQVSQFDIKHPLDSRAGVQVLHDTIVLRGAGLPTMPCVYDGSYESATLREQQIIAVNDPVCVELS